MKIKKIKIKNYKSIKDEISFILNKAAKKSCYILLGINESGKSNILEAISLINSEKEIDYSIDCHAEAEEKGEDILITYVLEIENHEFYKKQFITNGIDEELAEAIEITNIERKISINSKNERKDYIHIWIKEKKKVFSRYLIDNNEIKLKTADESNAENTDKILTKDKLEEYLEENFFSPFNKNIPSVIFWKSSEEKYLINKPINLNEFKDNHNISLPLKNCFDIAKIENIRDKIISIENNVSKLERLRDTLNDEVTKHINKVWPEHQVNIRFAINNMQLTFLIEEKDNTRPKYGLNQRSDGFKHFISILLNLSVENETHQLKNKIILLDEPEVHLHPSGEKYFRDELLKIAENNLVFFATHSVFMVDKKNLNRHFSVKKEKSITKLTQIEQDNPYKEEVLYESLGTSILEHIENNVLIFEGKTDRDIFDLYKRKFKTSVKFQNVSSISADGCENIIKYTKFFNKKLVKGFVIVDSDNEGQQMKKKVLKEENYNKKNTFEINDILNTNKKSSLEDLFNEKCLIDSIKEIYDISITLDVDKPFIEQIKEQLQAAKKPYREQDKEELKKIFFIKISKLKKAELEKEPYFTFFKKLKEKLEK